KHLRFCFTHVGEPMRVCNNVVKLSRSSQGEKNDKQASDELNLDMFGSPTRARTWDLRINRRTEPRSDSDGHESTRRAADCQRSARARAGFFPSDKSLSDRRKLIALGQ